MYDVQMKYAKLGDSDNTTYFKCENIRFYNNGYRFENILMDEFTISDLEINNEDIALIKIQ